MLVPLLGGLGLFLLGMMLMTDGLKALAGNALRSILTRFVAGPFSGMFWGAALTALVQSSHATTMTTIGFVSAGLLSFTQSLGVIFGANLGTTSTGWLVSLLGFKLSVGQAALPMIFGGAMLKLLGRERVAAAGLAIAGFGLLFVGIDALQLAMAGLAERIDPGTLPGADATWTGRALLVLIGLIMTVVMQSSSAAVATTLAALHTGAINLDQAAALVVGQNVGSAVTAAIAAIGASVPARRTAVAHILFNVLTGAVAFLMLPLFVIVVRFAADRMTDAEPGAIALAGFHTVFNVVGVCLFLPLVRPFARVVMRIVPDRGPVLTRHLDASVAQLGPVAVEAARRTVIDIGAVVTAAASSLVSADRPPHRVLEPLTAAEEALRETRRFVGKLGGGVQTADERRRHISTLHAIDHMDLLIEACREAEPATVVPREPALGPFAERTTAALAMAHTWLIENGPAPVAEMAAASAWIADQRRTQRARTLDRTAAGELDPERALEMIEAMRWLDRLVYHTWRSVHHLQDPPPGESTGTPEAFADAAAS